MSFALALTGGIASGKSTAAACFLERGIPVLDADRMGHELLNEDYALRKKVTALLGSKCLTEDGRLDRKMIGTLVFADAPLMDAFNAIVHPALVAKLWCAMQKQTGLFCVDCALIFEWGIAASFDEVWVVAARDELRIERLVRTRGLSPMAAIKRLQSQIDQDEKCELAHRVFKNNDHPKALREHLLKALDEVLERTSCE